MAAMRNDLLEIKTALGQNSDQNSGINIQNSDQDFRNNMSKSSFRNNFGSNNYLRSRYHPPRFQNRRKCSDCFKNGSNKCVHCFNCGSSNHRIAVCDQSGKKNGQ